MLFNMWLRLSNLRSLQPRRMAPGTRVYSGNFQSASRLLTDENQIRTTHKIAMVKLDFTLQSRRFIRFYFHPVEASDFNLCYISNKLRQNAAEQISRLGQTGAGQHNSHIPVY
jgi:hypothetical protein